MTIQNTDIFPDGVPVGFDRVRSHPPRHMWSVPSSITDPTRVITYYPHDTSWQDVEDLETLMAQCRQRLLSDDGDAHTLQHRLREYQYVHRHENEVRGGLWRQVPDEAWSIANAKITNCQLIRVRDTSDMIWWWIEKEFTLHARDAGTFTVVISKDLTCTCKFKTIAVDGKRSCEHVLYVLRYILRCPHPLLYQYAFLSVELEYIFAANPFFSYFPNKAPARVPQERVDPYPACVLCFRSIPLGVNHTALLPCRKCGHFAHRGCFEIFHDIRKPREPQICVLCEDEKEWRLPGQEAESADPQSQASVVEEGGNDRPVPVHEDKLVAMLYYETREKKKS
ncbi:hypothetical protein QBC45DRAFT_486516 [Copromyces sp. CBS 386.78]|nr:hypothetical protein QBC45DRAFT_486516 [Copromyces sp. CBS 386.78]